MFGVISDWLFKFWDFFLTFCFFKKNFELYVLGFFCEINAAFSCNCDFTKRSRNLSVFLIA